MLFLSGRRLALLFIVAVLAVSCAGPSAVPSKDTSAHSFSFTYQVTLDSLPCDSGTVDIWLPLPVTTAFQQVTDYRVVAALPYELYEDPVYHNRALHFFADNIEQAPSISVTFDLVRSERSARRPLADDSVALARELTFFLQPNRLVPVTEQIASEAMQVADSTMTTSAKARALYDHLCGTMQYDKTGEGWGRGDAVFACDARRGNCTDIHSLFISEARSLGIPARFIIGFPLPQDGAGGEISGYHCWAEFYTADSGWVPVDISEAIKHPERKESLFGHLDKYRVAFTMGRDIILRSGETSDTLNYFIYPVVRVNGQPYEGYRQVFTYAKGEAL